MGRIRLTQILPFLIPLRQKQRKFFFYSKMKMDNNIYAKEQKNGFYKNLVFENKEKLINEASGYELKYQYNKVYNLKLAAQVLNRVIIKPNETFSFWNLVKDADREIPFKEGLNLVDGKIKGSYGGGLCQLSNQLYFVFLHSPLSIIERSAHEIESFPHKDNDLYGVDATISEGWLDLKVANNTADTFQIVISFDEDFIYIRLLADKEQKEFYEIFNDNNHIYHENNKVYREVAVWRNQINKYTNYKLSRQLYIDKIEIGYQI